VARDTGPVEPSTDPVEEVIVKASIATLFLISISIILLEWAVGLAQGGGEMGEVQSARRGGATSPLTRSSVACGGICLFAGGKYLIGKYLIRALFFALRVLRELKGLETASLTE